MKRYTDLTREEMANVTHDELQKFIDIEIAYAGIIPADCPEPLPPSDIVLTKNDTAYEVCGSIYVKTIKDFEALSKIKLYKSAYDYYGAGYDYQYLEEVDIECKSPANFYSKDEVQTAAIKLKERRELKEAYEVKKKEFDKFEKDTYETRKAVMDVYNEAVNFKNSVNQALEQFKKYMDLSSQDEVIAKRFFREAYKNRPEIIEAVFPGMLDVKE
jgi:hypothetical protein